MNNLIIALVAWWIAEGSGLIQSLKYKLCIYKIWSIYPDGKLFPETRQQRRLKPLDCPMCLAFWIGLFFSISTKDYLLSPINGIICSAVAIFISKIYNRI